MALPNNRRVNRLFGGGVPDIVRWGEGSEARSNYQWSGIPEGLGYYLTPSGLYFEKSFHRMGRYPILVIFIPFGDIEQYTPTILVK
jgi:hypothetical protein